MSEVNQIKDHYGIFRSPGATMTGVIHDVLSVLEYAEGLEYVIESVQLALDRHNERVAEGVAFNNGLSSEISFILGGKHVFMD